MIEPEIRTLSASDGYRLSFRHWRVAAPPPRGHIVALHGIQSHPGWYDYSSRRICEAGFELDFLDRRGSGLNEQRRGDAAHADRLINDVVQFLGHIRHRRDPTVPVILMAVSWGGKLATVTAARRPDLIDALALLYPAWRARVRPRWTQRLKLALAERLGVRDREVPIPLDDAALFTAQPAWQAFIRNDPQALHRVTVSFLLANRELDRHVDAAPAAIHCPVLLMLAGRDQIIDNDATRRLFDRFDSTDRTVHEYTQARHTLEFEPDRDRFIDDLIAWLGRVGTA